MEMLTFSNAHYERMICSSVVILSLIFLMIIYLSCTLADCLAKLYKNTENIEIHYERHNYAQTFIAKYFSPNFVFVLWVLDALCEFRFKTYSKLYKYSVRHS